MFLIFIASGYVDTHPTVLPDKNILKVETVNHKYQDVIEIKGGIVNESRMSVSITSNDSGLVWNLEEVKYAFGGRDGINKGYYRIIIYGIPKNQVIIA